MQNDPHMGCHLSFLARSYTYKALRAQTFLESTTGIVSIIPRDSLPCEPLHHFLEPPQIRYGCIPCRRLSTDFRLFLPKNLVGHSTHFRSDDAAAFEHFASPSGKYGVQGQGFFNL